MPQLSIWFWKAPCTLPSEHFRDAEHIMCVCLSSRNVGCFFQGALGKALEIFALAFQSNKMHLLFLTQSVVGLCHWFKGASLPAELKIRIHSKCQEYQKTGARVFWNSLVTPGVCSLFSGFRGHSGRSGVAVLTAYLTEVLHERCQEEWPPISGKIVKRSWINKFFVTSSWVFHLERLLSGEWE